MEAPKQRSTPKAGFSASIDKEWQLQNWCLQTLYVPENHRADNLAEEMTDALETLGLDAAKQVCLTTDSASNMVCATSRRLK